jgi:hypothetical protein
MRIRLVLWARSPRHFARVHDFRAHLAELDRLLSALEERAREVRTSRLLGSPAAADELFESQYESLRREFDNIRGRFAGDHANCAR